MNIKKELEKQQNTKQVMHLNDVEVNPGAIRAIMINEVVPVDSAQDFYGSPNADYLQSTLCLFQKAGFHVSSIQEVLKMGIYITNAVKMPKLQSTIQKESIQESIPYLEKEISLFPNVKVIMLMGDVAKKAFNMITQKETQRNIVPAISTYKLRNSEIYYKGIRIMPSYIMTGGNILIEKSKVEMAAVDIKKMVNLIR